MKRIALLLMISCATPTATAQNITFGSGSCANGTQLERDSIFTSIASDSVDFFLWLGDNIYYRYRDWQNIDNMRAAYERRQSTPALARFLSSTPQRAIWDDHDYGPNDSDSTFTGRHESLQVFNEIWPETPINIHKYKDTRWHELRSQTLFIGLDNRMHRGPVGTQMLGQSQLNYVDSLLQSYPDAPFVFIAIGSQVLNEAKVWENYVRYPERAELLSICSRHRGQVIFLTGDRHHSEINQSPNGLLEFCTSPLTSTCYPPKPSEIELNTNLIQGTVTSIPNYSVIQVFEPEQRVIVTYKNVDGETLLTQTFQVN